jgi:hypothetical protein
MWGGSPQASSQCLLAQFSSNTIHLGRELQPHRLGPQDAPLMPDSDPRFHLIAYNSLLSVSDVPELPTELKGHWLCSMVYYREHRGRDCVTPRATL